MSKLIMCTECGHSFKEDPQHPGYPDVHKCKPNLINHPLHYTSHPSGVECITITEHMNFNIGNAVKYLWRSDHKGAKTADLEKARWYIDRELSRLADDDMAKAVPQAACLHREVQLGNDGRTRCFHCGATDVGIIARQL